MFVKIVFIVIFATSALARHVPDINDLDEDDELLFRAAYDTPSYNQYDYNQYHYEEDENPTGKLDLLKDGMFAIKAKIMEMKAINKALAANMLSTKLKLKELLVDKKKLVFKPLKKHHHVEIEQKPVYSYQTPPQPSYPQYQHYNAPAPQYAPPPPTYVHDPYYGH